MDMEGRWPQAGRRAPEGCWRSTEPVEPISRHRPPRRLRRCRVVGCSPRSGFKLSAPARCSSQAVRRRLLRLQHTRTKVPRFPASEGSRVFDWTLAGVRGTLWRLCLQSSTHTALQSQSRPVTLVPSLPAMWLACPKPGGPPLLQTPEPQRTTVLPFDGSLASPPHTTLAAVSL